MLSFCIFSGADVSALVPFCPAHCYFTHCLHFHCYLWADNDDDDDDDDDLRCNVNKNFTFANIWHPSYKGKVGHCPSPEEMPPPRGANPSGQVPPGSITTPSNAVGPWKRKTVRTKSQQNEIPTERKPIRTNSHQNEYSKYCALLWFKCKGGKTSVQLLMNAFFQQCKPNIG